MVVYLLLSVNLYHQNNTNIQIEVCELLLDRTKFEIEYKYRSSVCFTRANLMLFCHS